MRENLWVPKIRFRLQTVRFRESAHDFGTPQSTYVYGGERPTVMVDPSGATFVPSDCGEAAAEDATSSADAGSIAVFGLCASARVPAGAVRAARAAWAAGFRVILVATVAIAGAESSWNTILTNGVHKGLWQIDVNLWGRGTEGVRCTGIAQNWADPYANARCAYKIVHLRIREKRPKYQDWFGDGEVRPDKNSVYTNRNLPACGGVCYAIAKAAVKKSGH